MFIIALAAGLRFWQLGDLPPGLYRDEAYNGLDALQVLDGQHALFFPANNGREPAYIYLTALFVSLFGRTALAVRMGAAVVGTLTTWLVYKLAQSWHGRSTGLFAAFIWAITLWPVHLSRIGLRTILLAPFLAATFWVGTLAYRQQKRWLWLLAGLLYGAGYYTYLAIRFTPILLAAILLFLLLRRKGLTGFSNLSGLAWFGLGTAVSLLPFAILIFNQPDLFLGRTGQVSILNSTVNGGDLWATLWQNIGQALGMFLWHGDTILRHNPAGRPVFDLFMAAPFLVGLGVSLRNWRRPAAMILLLWTAVMLGPTILAADTPHFLRASGLLPAIVIFPAIGLARLWEWERLPTRLRQTAVILLALGSLIMTVKDYVAYGRSPDTSYLFESAARTLSETANEEALNIITLIDNRFWSGWPSLQFLITNPRTERFNANAGLPPLPQTSQTQLFVWPYEDREFIPPALPPNALIWSQNGPLARGDWEPEPYPLYVRYLVVPEPPDWPTIATFGDAFSLRQADAMMLDEQTMQVDLIWATEMETAVPPLTTFVHILNSDGLIAQDDAPPGSGNWPHSWWRPGLLLHERRTIILPEPYDPARHQIRVGLYDNEGVRLPVFNAAEQATGDSWQLTIGN